MLNVNRQSTFSMATKEQGLLYKLRYFFLRRVYFTIKKRVEFYRVVRSLTVNGISIQSALRLYSEMLSKYNKRESGMKFIVDDVLSTMSRGIPYEAAIAKWVPREESIIIETSSKNVARACEVVTQFAENILSIQSALVSALTYPVMMIIVLVVCISAFTFYIMPSMIKMSSPANWPTLARALYHFTSFISAHAISLGAMLCALAVFTVWSFANLSNLKSRSVLDLFPPWSLYKTYSGTTFLIALASLLRSGSSFHHSLGRIKSTATPYLRAYINLIIKRLGAGSNFGESRLVGIFGGNVLISLAVFALTNKLELGIQFLANENLEEQQKEFVRKGKILGYTLMVIVAMVIGWVMLSLYGMQSSISR
jgi:type II secretory pathway component PulF